MCVYFFSIHGGWGKGGRNKQERQRISQYELLNGYYLSYYYYRLILPSSREVTGVATWCYWDGLLQIVSLSACYWMNLLLLPGWQVCCCFWQAVLSLTSSHYRWHVVSGGLLPLLAVSQWPADGVDEAEDVVEALSPRDGNIF